jgi:hypothetical protein
MYVLSIKYKPFKIKHKRFFLFLFLIKDYFKLFKENPKP